MWQRRDRRRMPREAVVTNALRPLAISAGRRLRATRRWHEGMNRNLMQWFVFLIVVAIVGACNASAASRLACVMSACAVGIA